MPGDKDARRRAEWLAEEVAKAKARMKGVTAEAVQAARKVAVTEEQLADTFDRLAQTQPRHAARLRAKSAIARDQAARERQWAKDSESAAQQDD